MNGKIIRTEKDFAIAREEYGGHRTYYLYQPYGGRKFAIGEAVEWIPDSREERQLGYRARRIKTPIQGVEVSKQTREQEGVENAKRD
jgi:hypothetical protein